MTIFPPGLTWWTAMCLRALPAVVNIMSQLPHWNILVLS